MENKKTDLIQIPTYVVSKPGGRCKPSSKASSLQIVDDVECVAINAESRPPTQAKAKKRLRFESDEAPPKFEKSAACPEFEFPDKTVTDSAARDEAEQSQHETLSQGRLDDNAKDEAVLFNGVEPPQASTTPT